MALKLKCPCGERLTAPESAAGKRGKCSKCGMRFVIPGPKAVGEPARKASASIPDGMGLGLPSHDDGVRPPSSDFDKLLDDVLTEPGPVAPSKGSQNTASTTNLRPAQAGTANRRSARRDNGMSGLTNVRIGVNLVYYGLYCLVVGILAMPLSFVMALISPAFAAVVILAVPVLIVFGSVLGLTGRIMCLSVPHELKTSEVIYAAVACDFGALLANLGYHAGLVPGFFRLLTLVGFFLFVVFLKRLSSYISDGVSENRAANVLRLCIALFIATAVIVLGIFLIPENMSAFYILPVFIPALVMLFVTIIFYAMLLVSLRRALSVAV